MSVTLGGSQPSVSLSCARIFGPAAGEFEEEHLLAGMQAERRQQRRGPGRLSVAARIRAAEAT
jgi:hypothetical protein